MTVRPHCPALFAIGILTACTTAACSSAPVAHTAAAPAQPKAPTFDRADEPHLTDVKRLTFSGQSAEAYWAFGGKELILQSRPMGDTCDRIYRLPLEQALLNQANQEGAPAGQAAMIPVSNGEGATTCSYFLPGDDEVIYASTQLGGAACPPKADRSKGYVWSLYDSFDIFRANKDGTNVRRLTDTKGYDAEATVCAKDGTIVFTSVRDGDIELYKMDKDGKNVVRLTHEPGYDGGAFFNSDCSKIVWRASRPKGKDLEEYKDLLAQGLVKPSKLEIWTMNADGSDPVQVTYLNSASFAPFFSHDSKRILFSSNYGDPKSREFDLFAIDVSGARLERVTHAPGFDGFPMLSPDGTLLAFGSNRAAPPDSRETDVFLAKWNDDVRAELIDQPADHVLADVSWLADPAREGRGVGTQGLADAGAFIEQRFNELGLSPLAMEDGAAPSMRYPFQVPVKAIVDMSTILELDGKALTSEQFTALSFSASADIKGALAFVGYGLSDKEKGLDDYAGLDVKGKIVVVRRFVPQSDKLDPAAQRRLGDLRYKAWVAKEHGASGILVVDLPEKPASAAADWKLPDEAVFPRVLADGTGDVGIPALIVKREAMQAYFDKLAALAARKRPLNMRIKDTIAHANVKLNVEQAEAFDVVARIPAGAENKLPGVVIVGAHYDHLGLGEHGSFEPDSHKPHLGADDNASGTAALLETARVLMSQQQALRRDVLVIAFSGEERGVLGSTAFTKKLPAGLKMTDVVAMLNMDMVGRMRRNQLSVLGTDSAPEWSELAAAACAAARVECTLGGDGYGPSDHMPFYAAGAPVVHLFSGAHADYHRPSDSADKINAAGLAAAARVEEALALAVANREQRLTYKSAPAPAPQGDFRSFAASLGTIPDYAPLPAGSRRGVLLSGVRAGGPAEKGGLMRGDLLVKLGVHDVGSVEELMFALNASKPGQTVTAVVVREGKEVPLTVTFAEGGKR
ncbi:MAG: M28 family peptidase [Deltaproteobacteria bacterium]|nr:M28 family peptidase [Deltaproteobacteria bacterium]